MASAERNSISMSAFRAGTSSNISQYQSLDNAKENLVDEIDKLRKEMTDTFLLEHSLTADSVVELSRQLDLKINEYMKQVLISRE
jgi:hypothetical protein